MEINVKKKVLVFVPRFPSLTETFIDRELSKLAESPVLDIQVLALEKGRGAVSPNLANKISYDKLGPLNLLMSLGLWFTKTARVLGAYKLLTSQKRALTNFYTLLKAVGYAQKIQRYQPEIIFAHFLAYPSTLMMLVSHILNVPYAISAHAIDIMVDREYLIEKAQTAQFIVICNKNAYQHVLANLDSSLHHKIFLQYHGIDFSRELPTKLPPKLDKPLVFSVGRLVEKKGHKYLIEASRILRDMGVDHYLRIAGGGSESAYAEITSLIAEKGLVDVVTVLGGGKGVPYTEVETNYLMANVVAFSGVEAESGDVDGVPNVLVESSYYGVPMVSTDVGSTTDLIVNGETGLLVSQKDPQELATALKTVLTNKDLAQKLVENAHKKAQEAFDLNKNVIRLEELLCSTI